jgi:hypothetical protein
MAPYQPPVDHYSELDVSWVDSEDIYAFIGVKGRRFYWLSRFLGLSYLWFDEKRKVLEIWGPYYVHENKQSALVIEAELEHFIHIRQNETHERGGISRVPDETASYIMV